jgi:general secretion pathway protein G
MRQIISRRWTQMNADNSQSSNRRSSAFIGGQIEAGVTLIEMLVVVTIMGLFAALATSNVVQKIEAAKVTKAVVQIETFTTSLGSYKLDVGAYPTTEQGLKALWTKPDGVANWSGPYTLKENSQGPLGLRVFV